MKNRDSSDFVDVRWSQIFDTDCDVERTRLAGLCLKHGAKERAESLVKYHKLLVEGSQRLDGSLTKSDRFVSECLLIKIGFSDTKVGHKYLQDLVERPTCVGVDDSAMEAMAFEQKQWDGLYILEKLQNSSCQAVKRSCLYALQYKKVHDLFPELYRDVVLPCLKHEDARERVFAIDVICTHPQAKAVLEELRLIEKNDWVKRAIDDALVIVSEMEGSESGNN